MSVREFICLDCKVHVFRYGAEPGERCYNCAFIRRLEASPEEEAALRKLLGVELARGDDDLRKKDDGPGRQDPD